MHYRGLLLLVIIALLLAVPAMRQKQAQDQRRQCMSNQKNVGTALEMYSTDNAGRYPPYVGILTPNYLRELPRCPTNESDYYVVTASDPDLYTIICRGYHPAAPPPVRSEFP